MLDIRLTAVYAGAVHTSTTKDLRIRNHPLLAFKRERKISFLFEGKKVEGYENESVAAALSAAGVPVFGYSKHFAHPRGWFCGVGPAGLAAGITAQNPSTPETGAMTSLISCSLSLKKAAAGF